MNTLKKILGAATVEKYNSISSQACPDDIFDVQ